MRWLAVCLLLLGCSQEPPPRRVESAAAAQIQSRTFRVGESRLTVLEIPIQSGRRVEWMRCLVWQGERGEILHCPTDGSDATVPPSHDALSAAERQ